jgi:hypothetical protein
MKTIRIQIQLGLLLLVTAARANTTLSVGNVTFYMGGGPCWTDTLLSPSPLTESNSFTLAGTSGTGFVSSYEAEVADDVRLTDHYLYTYSLNLSAMSGPGHCVSLLIHFGTPLNCIYSVMLITNGSGVHVTSATLAPYGDITMTFGAGGCMTPGQTATTIALASDTTPKYGTVTVIDEYVNPNSGLTNTTVVNVGALVPDIPPDWVYPVQFQIPYFVYQGFLDNVCNTFPYYPYVNGAFNFRAQLVDAGGTNGVPVGPVITQTVQVANGLFTTPLPFDPSLFYGPPSWLSLAVQPVNGGAFTSLNPPQPVAPTPQALYAYSAGVVADISSNQAVTSLNALTGPVQLQPGNGISLDTNGNTLTISAVAGQSDRNLKTDLAAVGPADILAKVAALPVQSWRYTNEMAGIRHVGPMAQDFKAAFGLGKDDKIIGYLDEGGVALAAIQGLNQKVEDTSQRAEVIGQQATARIQKLEADNAELKARLEKIEQLLNPMKEGKGSN